MDKISTVSDIRKSRYVERRNQSDKSLSKPFVAALFFTTLSPSTKLMTLILTESSPSRKKPQKNKTKQKKKKTTPRNDCNRRQPLTFGQPKLQGEGYSEHEISIQIDGSRAADHYVINIKSTVLIVGER